MFPTNNNLPSKRPFDDIGSPVDPADREINKISNNNSVRSIIAAARATSVTNTGSSSFTPPTMPLERRAHSIGMITRPNTATSYGGQSSRYITPISTHSKTTEEAEEEYPLTRSAKAVRNLPALVRLQPIEIGNANSTKGKEQTVIPPLVLPPSSVKGKRTREESPSMLTDQIFSPRSETGKLPPLKQTRRASPTGSDQDPMEGVNSISLYAKLAAISKNADDSDLQTSRDSKPVAWGEKAPESTEPPKARHHLQSDRMVDVNYFSSDDEMDI